MAKNSVRERIKVLLGIELVVLVIALVAVLMPRRGSTDLINLPPDLATYFCRVLLCFAGFNGILLALGLAFWIYTLVKGREPNADDSVS